MSCKYAYLILAHKYGQQLITLLRMLDDNNNDIYVHIDKKTKDFPFDLVKDVCKRSYIYFVDCINVQWGGYSLVRAELSLLKAATQNREYEYLHLISGEDLPIKRQDEIRHFLAENKGKEFICFDSDIFEDTDRVSYWYFLQELIGKSNRSRYAFLLSKIQETSVKLQKRLSIKRNTEVHFRKGAQWFSITDDLARYVVGHEDEIERQYRYTKCADEIFLQTLVYNSPFYQQVYSLDYNNSCHAMLRLIDWKKGNPYIYRNHDFEELIHSEELFARKFDDKVDFEIIEAIKKHFVCN